MIAMKSRTFAKPETSEEGLPVASLKGEMEVAADRMRLGSAWRSSCKKERKFAVS